jgi:hypothetical protein
MGGLIKIRAFQIENWPKMFLTYTQNCKTLIFCIFYEESKLEIVYFYENFTNWNQPFFLNPKNL